MPWRRKCQPTPVFLPGKSHGQRSLADYHPWGFKRAEQDLVTKEHVSIHTHRHTINILIQYYKIW